MKGESEKRWPIMCVCREKARGDHNSKSDLKHESVCSVCV